MAIERFNVPGGIQQPGAVQQPEAPLEEPKKLGFFAKIKDAGMKFFKYVHDHPKEVIGAVVDIAATAFGFPPSLREGAKKFIDFFAMTQKDLNGRAQFSVADAAKTA
jgi:hypothetical protein